MKKYYRALTNMNKISEIIGIVIIVYIIALDPG